MNRTQILLIRAIKSNEAERRLKRLYKMFYLNEYYDARHVANILKDIVVENDIMSVTDWIDGLNPDNDWKYGINSYHSYYEKCVMLMSSHIRLTPVFKLKNFIKPAKFRKMK